MAIVTIQPGNSGDDSASIQNAINTLGSGDTLKGIGSFVSKNTILLKSNMTWDWTGSSIKLADGMSDGIWLISDKSGGVTSLTMTGGTYDGNKDKQNKYNIHNDVVSFKAVTKSNFSNMTMVNSTSKNFVLDTGCNNNTCTKLIGRNAGYRDVIVNASNTGNGLGDRGNNNTWTDCIAEDNWSDCWIIKCRDSKFIRCIGSGSGNAVGFGPFADRNITGNRFEDCKAFGNIHAGIAFNIPKKMNGGKIKLESNYFQMECYNNGTNGVRLHDGTSDGSLTNNTFDVLVHDNKNIGFWIEDAKVKNNPGSPGTNKIIAYNNKTSDLTLLGSGNNFDVYHPKDKPAPKISKGSNAVSTTDFDCTNKPSNPPWCVTKYCGGIINPEKWKCSGAPDYICTSDNKDGTGIYNSEQLCKDACNPNTIEKWKCSGSPDYICTSDNKDGTGIYNSEQLCKDACKAGVVDNTTLIIVLLVIVLGLILAYMTYTKN